MKPPLLRKGLVSLVICVSAGAVAAGAGDDSKAVQGTWVVTDHQPQAEPKVVYEKAVIKGDKLTLHSDFMGKKHEVECVFKLDPTATPKRIDFTPVSGASKGQTYPGLYELKKDGEMRICYRGPGSTRPKNFDDKNDGAIGTTFLVLKIKPDA